MLDENESHTGICRHSGEELSECLESTRGCAYTHDRDRPALGIWLWCFCIGPRRWLCRIFQNLKQLLLTFDPGSTGLLPLALTTHGVSPGRRPLCPKER